MRSRRASIISSRLITFKTVASGIGSLLGRVAKQSKRILLSSGMVVFLSGEKTGVGEKIFLLQKIFLCPYMAFICSDNRLISRYSFRRRSNSSILPLSSSVRVRVGKSETD